MKQFIKNAITYSASLPAATELAAFLEAKRFDGKLLDNELSRAGFVPNPASGELVTPFPGGYSFTVRIDKRLLPVKVVKEEVRRRIAVMELEQRRRLIKKECSAVKEAVLNELMPTALIQSAMVHGYYHTATSRLILPLTSDSTADMIMSLLLKAVGTIKASTIYIDDLQHGITTRLRAALEHDEAAFEGFELGTYVKLVNPIKEAKESVVYELEDLRSGNVGLIERLDERGFRVAAVGLQHGEIGFRLTQSFRLTNIELPDVPQDDAGEDVAYAWRHQASVEVLLLNDVINQLCALLGYAEPAAEETAA